MKRTIVLALAFALILGVFSGCAGKEPSEPVAGEPESVKIGISLPTKDDGDWNRAGDLMKNGLSVLGYSVALDYASNDVDTQITQIEKMLDSGCGYLIIAAVDGIILGNALGKAKEKNVPVIAYDRMLMNSDAVSYYVTFDPYMIGLWQGEYVRDRLNLDDAEGRFSVEFVAGDPDDEKAERMFAGTMDALESYINRGVLEVRSGQVEFEEAATLGWAAEAAYSRMEAILYAHYSDGETLDAVLCSSDSCAIGAAAAIEDGYHGEQPIVTGCGCERDNVKNIIKGTQSMSFFCDTGELASRAVEMIKSLVRGETVLVNDTESFDNGNLVVPTYKCEPVLVDKDNYHEILVEPGFYTEYELN